MASVKIAGENGEILSKDCEMVDVESDDSMTTHTESKYSRSRAEKGRGPTRRARRLARAEEHYKVMGKEWKDKERLKQERAQLALPGIVGSVAVCVYDKMMELKKKEENLAGDEKRKAIEDALVKEIPVEMAKWVHNVDGEPRCVICGKAATVGHLESSEHVKRIEEDALGTIMCGDALTTRRFNGDKCVGVATKRLLYDYWGDALENLPTVARRIHLQKGVFWNGKHQVIPESARYELGVVSYPGQGKYKDCLFRAFHDLPDQLETATVEQRQFRSPSGQGWWPVIALDSVFEESVRKVLVVCWYQLLSDGRVICWWIYL